MIPATRDEAVAAGLQNAKDVGGREVVNGIVAVDTPALGREVQVGKHGLRHGLNGKEERQRLNRLANAHIGELLKKAVLVDGWTDQENPKAHINALCAVLNTKEGNALVSILAKDNTWDKRTVIESVSVTSLYSVNAKAEPLTRPYERPQTGSASDTFTVAYLRERWQERFGKDLAKKRAEHELKAVRKRYEGTDQWMKAPNGGRRSWPSGSGCRCARPASRHGSATGRTTPKPSTPSSSTKTANPASSGTTPPPPTSEPSTPPEAEPPWTSRAPTSPPTAKTPPDTDRTPIPSSSPSNTQPTKPPPMPASPQAPPPTPAPSARRNSATKATTASSSKTATTTPASPRSSSSTRASSSPPPTTAASSTPPTRTSAPPSEEDTSTIGVCGRRMPSTGA